MKTSRRIGLAAVTALCVVSPAAAQERGPHSTVGLAVKVSTLGVGVDAAIPVIDRANVRVGFNTFTLNHDFDNDGITLAASLRMRSVSAYFDWFAFGGGFHISPGVMLYNGNQLSAIMSVPAGQDFELGDETLYSNAAIYQKEGLSASEMKPKIIANMKHYRDWKGFDATIGRYITLAYTEAEVSNF